MVSMDFREVKCYKRNGFTPKKVPMNLRPFRRKLTKLSDLNVDCNSLEDRQLGMGKTCIYVIEGGGKRKIGLSREPEFRMSNMQVGSPSKLTLERSRIIWACWALEIETHVHNFLADTHSHGEWFDCSYEMGIVAMREASKLNTKLYNEHMKARQPIITAYYWKYRTAEMTEGYRRFNLHIPVQYK